MGKKREPIFKFWTKWGDFILSWKWMGFEWGFGHNPIPRLVGCFDDLCRFSDLSAISRLGISEIVAATPDLLLRKPRATPPLLHIL